MLALRRSGQKEVEEPKGWKVIGPIERYDQRDHINARMLLREGTSEYREYYSRHPERKEQDDSKRLLAMKNRKKLRESEHMNYGITRTFYGRDLQQRKQ